MTLCVFYLGLFVLGTYDLKLDPKYLAPFSWPYYQVEADGIDYLQCVPFCLGATMGWFVGMLLLPLMYKHVEFLSEHNWVPYIVLLVFAIAGGILIICIQKVCCTNLSIQ